MNSSFSHWNNAAQWYDQKMGDTGDALNATIIRPLVLEMLGDIRGASILEVSRHFVGMQHVS